MALQIEGHALPLANPTVRIADLLLPVFHFKWRVLFTIAIVSLLGFAYTVSSPPQYVAHVSLLALLRADYAMQANAGQSTSGSSSFEVDEIIGTESRLLGRSELHREVIEEIGIANIYPNYLAPRTGLLHSIKETVLRYLDAMDFSVAEQTTPAPIDMATIDFDRHLSLSTKKSSHVIDLSFIHSNPKIAADALNTLVRVYLRERSALYNDEQAPIVKARLQELQQNVTNADSELANYKRMYEVGAFASRRELLLQQQSGLETTMHVSESAVREQEARVEYLQSELKKIPTDLVTEHSTDIEQRTQPQRMSMDAIAVRLAQARTTYSQDSGIVKQLEVILAERKREIENAMHKGAASVTRTAQNPLWLAASGDFLRASDELQASNAKLASVKASLALVNHILRVTNEREEGLTKLERQRIIAEENYRAVSQTYESRRVADAVDRERREAVRVANIAIPSTIDSSHSRLILFSFMVIGTLLGLFTAWLSNYRRRIYLTPQEIEYDLGLPLLVAIPKRRWMVL